MIMYGTSKESLCLFIYIIYIIQWHILLIFIAFTKNNVVNAKFVAAGLYANIIDNVLYARLAVALKYAYINEFGPNARPVTEVKYASINEFELNVLTAEVLK